MKFSATQRSEPNSIGAMTQTTPSTKEARSRDRLLVEEDRTSFSRAAVVDRDLSISSNKVECLSIFPEADFLLEVNGLSLCFKCMGSASGWGWEM